MESTSYRRLPPSHAHQAGRELVSSSLDLLKTTHTTSHELDELHANTPIAQPKWNAKSRTHPTTFSRKMADRLREMLRSLRLLILLGMGPWKKKEEEPKIALHIGWPSVLTGLLIHVLPLTACIALIVLNSRSTFLSGHVSTLAFQFLAKFLELLAQASLASALFVYLRSLYTDSEPVPFGALFAGLQISSINYLWSLEFAGVVTSGRFKQTKKLGFVGLITFSIILAAGIGPSIAIALTPTPGYFSSGWAEAWVNATEDQLLPSNIDPNVLVYDFSSDCTSGYCARYGWQTAISMAQSSRRSNDHNVSQHINLAVTQDALPNREMQCNIGISDGPTDMSTIATIPSKVVAWSLSMMAQQMYSSTAHLSASSKNFTTRSRQPLVEVACEEANWLSPTSINITVLDDQFSLQSKSLHHLSASSSFAWAFLDRNDSYSKNATSSGPSVWIVVSHPQNLEPPDRSVEACAIYARYAHVRNTISLDKDTWLSGNALVVSRSNIDYVQADGSESIMLPSLWVNRTLPPLSTLLSNGLSDVDLATFFATSLAISMAQWPQQIFPSPDDSPALYGLNPDTGILVGNQEEDNAMDPNDSLHWFSRSKKDHVLYPGSEIAEKQGKYRLQMNVSSFGYGYKIDQPTKIIAISVLSAYCLYTMTFIVLSLTFYRIHSNAWDSISELTALALMSRPDDKLRNTSAGIETVALFRLPVNIRAVANSHLEILFEDGEGSPSSGKVERGVEYG